MKSRRCVMHPATLYLLLTVGVVLFSWIGDIYELHTVLPASGEVVAIRSVLSAEGIRWLLRHVVTNFTGFAPLGMAVMAFFGLGVADHSGFLQAFARRWLRGSRSRMGLILAVVVSGILSNVVGDAGYILLVPLSGFLFQAAGLHPVAGIITAYVSVACGYSANLFLGTMDPLLARITREAMVSSHSTFGAVGALSNMLFMMASSVLLTAVISVLSLGLTRRMPAAAEGSAMLHSLSRKENRSLNLALSVGAAYCLVVVFATFSPWGILRGITGGLTRSPFIVGALFLISLGIGLMGTVYGFVSGRYRSDNDVVQGLASHFRTAGLFFVLAFFAAQLLACFSYSQLDKWLTIEGAYALASVPVSGGWFLLVFVLGVACINLFLVSSTLKWTLLSFVFIPLFASAGIAPCWAQCAYRIGDSVTNAITPFMFYMPFVLACLSAYVSEISYADVFRYTWRFTVFIGASWLLLFFVWYGMGWPLGW